MMNANIAKCTKTGKDLLTMDLNRYIAADIQNKFEFHNYGHALEILHESFSIEWNELQDCFSKLYLTLDDIKKAGGNESPVPKRFDEILYPYGWREIRISGDLVVKNILADQHKEEDGSKTILPKSKQSLVT